MFFIDETWIKVNMTRTHGWARCSERLKDFTPHGQWKTLTFLAALRDVAVVAPYLIDGPFNGTLF